jgi:RNA polymerase sigma-70 factor (ECF subfamily)
MTREQEIKIITRIKNGESALFNGLVLIHAPRILSIVRGIVGNREDAQEIAQDVFVKAFFSLHSFRGDSSFSTWLCRIAYNMSISSTRKRKQIIVPLEQTNIAVCKEEFLYYENETDKNEYIALYEIINKLPPGERFLIISFYLHKKSVAEISSITGMSEINVKVKLHRIRKKLSICAKEKMEVIYG